VNVAGLQLAILNRSGDPIRVLPQLATPDGGPGGCLPGCPSLPMARPGSTRKEAEPTVVGAGLYLQEPRGVRH
jgi:hypothetical protein